MFCPPLCARVEKRDNSTTIWIDGRQVSAFIAVAVQTSQRQILGHGLAAMLDWSDVINLVRKRQVILMDPAVFAPPCGPFDDHPAQCLRNARPTHRGLVGGSQRQTSARFEEK